MHLEGICCDSHTYSLFTAQARFFLEWEWRGLQGQSSVAGDEEGVGGMNAEPHIPEKDGKGSPKGSSSFCKPDLELVLLLCMC